MGALRPLGSDVPRGRIAVSITSTTLLIETLIALDGSADAILLLSSHTADADVARLMRASGCAYLLSDREDLQGTVTHTAWLGESADGSPTVAGATHTEWLLTTSGTTGPSKVVRHTLPSLLSAVRLGDEQLRGARWGLVYDATRFAGLQVVLHAVAADGTLICAAHDAPIAKAVDALVDLGCDHLSATPSLWRRLLMHPRIADMPLRRVTLGGEAADDSVLGAVSARFPTAKVSHIYASSEAGVGFTVTDGQSGFPADYLATGRLRGVSLKIVDGMLWLRSDGAASDYLGSGQVDRDDEGYICSGDLVELRDSRVVFRGRSGSGINVGGVTVAPDEVEAVLNSHPRVLASHVTARMNNVTGALLVADVVAEDIGDDEGALRKALVSFCKGNLAREAVPRKIRFVTEIDLSPAGKVGR